MLTPAQVVPFLQNQDQNVRDLAERYLIQSHDPSPATAEDAWRMSDHLGKDKPNPAQYSIIPQLPQTQASLDRILQELPTEENETRRNYLEVALVKLPYGLLMRFHDRIEGAAGLSEDFRSHLARRIELTSIPPQELWDQLMKLGEELMQNWDDAEGYDPRPAQLLIEALARSPESAQWAISTLNDESITDFREIFAVELLGQMRHRPAADLIADELISDEDSDFLLESSTDALIRIGGLQVVQAIQSRWQSMTSGFKLYACDVLSGVKLKEGEAALGEYLKSETNLGIRTKIAIGLCDTASNDPQVLEGLRKMVNDGKWDMAMVDLDEDVVALFTMIGHDVPELPRWRATLQDAGALKKRRAKALQQFTPSVSQMPALDDFDGDLQSWQQDDELGPKSAAPAAVKPIRRETPKVGRNDPCPCGSGKKYKKCCGK